MDYTIVILLLVAAAVLILAIKFIQGILKTVFYALLILVLVSAVFGYFFIKDSSSLIDGLRTKDTLFILKDGNDTITGFSISNMNISSAKSLSDAQLGLMSSYYQKGDYKSMLGTNFKLFIIDKKAFPKTNNSFDPDAVIAYLKGNDQTLELLSPKNMPDPKAMAFSLLVVYSFKQDPGYLITEYKAGNVIIYPETFVFKVFKFLLGKK